MNNEIRIENRSNKLFITAPKCDAFLKVGRARGKWDAAARAWAFDWKDESFLRDELKRIYGVDDGVPPLCDVRVKLGRLNEIEGKSGGVYIQAFGRTIVSKFGRDSRPKLGEDCVLIAGNLGAGGGSMKHPRINASPDVILEVREVPRLVVEAELADYDGAVEIVDRPLVLMPLTAAATPQPRSPSVTPLFLAPVTVYVNDQEVVLPMPTTTGLMIKTYAKRQGVNIRVGDRLVCGELTIEDDATILVDANVKLLAVKAVAA